MSERHRTARWTTASGSVPLSASADERCGFDCLPGRGTWPHSTVKCPSDPSHMSPDVRFTALLSLVAVSLLGVSCQRVAHNAVQPLRESAAEWDVRAGRDRVARNDPEGAAGAFRRAIAHDPRNSVAQAELGRILAAEGDFSQAADHYREAVKADPTNLKYALALGHARERQAEMSPNRQEFLQAAARTYAHVRWLDQTNGEALIGMGRCLRLLGEFDAAAELLLTAAGWTPRDARMHLELAAVYHAVGMQTEALAEYDRVLELDPKNLTAHNASGIINLRLSRSEDAAKTCRQSSTPEQAPADATQRASASSSTSASSRQRALAYFRKSLEIDPHQPRIRMLLETLEPAASPLAGGTDVTDKQ